MKLSTVTRRSIVVSVSFVVLVVGLLLYFRPVWLENTWRWYHRNRVDITPLGTFALAAVVAWAALAQARTARLRHEKQTDADRRRRITESFSKAAELLGNDKIEVRLGGIYTMERISQESPEDYWPVMETLTAFVRENARWKQPIEDASESLFCPDEPAASPSDNRVPTDIAAVLSVICRRDKVNREREKKMGWLFDLRGTDLRGAQLRLAHFENADLTGAHLERAELHSAHFEGALLVGAHLECAFGYDADLENAALHDAHLEGARLDGVNFEGATLLGAHLEDATLLYARGLTATALAGAYGDASTKLPEGVARPAAWPPADP